MIIIVDIKDLKEKILEDENNIRLILESIGCDRITSNPKEYRCAKNEEDPNATRVCVKLNEHLSAKIYDSVPVKGDIFTIIMALKNVELKESIAICCKALGIEYSSADKYIGQSKPKRKAFGGFYSKVQKEYEVEYEYHSEEILKSFLNKGNSRFADDGIAYDVQTIFNVMFDLESNRVTVPWRDSVGRIVGIMGRFMAGAEYCTQMNISKWLPLKGLNFPKSNFLYGYYENYKHILESGRVYVGESEKFPMQNATYGVWNSVAIGSHDMSDIQRRLLMALGVDIVLAFDNDIDDDFKKEQCLLFKSKSAMLRRRVGYMSTKNILKEKESPSDRGIETWNECVENIVWVIED